MTNEQRLIEDYVSGKINLYDMQCQLNIDAASEEKAQAVYQSRLLNKLSQNYGIAKSPEDIILEKERYYMILSVLSKLKKNMPDDWWYIMVQIAIYKKSQTELAKKLNISQSVICRKIKRAILLASRLISNNEYKECFVSQSQLEANTPEIKIKYPADFVSGNPCKMHEYLNNSFDNIGTYCGGYCGRYCTNKFMKEKI